MATRRLLSARRAAAFTGAVFVTLTLLPQASHADPDLTIEQVQARVDHLYEEAEHATERAHTVRLEVQQTRDHLERVEARLADQKAELAELDQAMADYAVALYTSGGIDPTLQVMLSSDPEDVLGRARSLDQVSRIQDAEYRKAQVARLAVAQTEAELDQELARLREQEAKLAAEEREVKERLAEAKQLLASLKEEEREQLAAMQAERAAAAAEASREAVASIPAPAPSANGLASTAVSYALSKVGSSYVFGAAGPYSFDCSGLTSAAWAQAGVYLPHSAAAQYGATARISQSDLQPGDLVFFYGGLSHVGMYVGGGMFVHAANPGDGVLVEPLFSGYWASAYVGAGRV